MTDEDRRRYDPFAPHSLVGAVQPPVSEDDDQGGSDLEDMRKADLVALAEEQGLPTYGSKADLVERLRG